MSRATDIGMALVNASESIPYRPELNRITGGPIASIILQQVLYWYKKQGYKPFFKFRKPCDHELYKEGDSWIEELGFSVKRFDRGLGDIAQKANRKQVRDPKALVYYWTTLDRVTYFEPNLEAIGNAFLEFPKMPKGDLYRDPERELTEIPKRELSYTETTSEITTENTNNTVSVDLDKSTGIEVVDESSHVTTEQVEKIQGSLFPENPTNNHSVDTPPTPPQQAEENLDQYYELFNRFRDKPLRKTKKSEATLRRFIAKYGEEAVKGVMAYWCDRCRYDPQSEQYIRFSTIFRPTKFEDKMEAAETAEFLGVLDDEYIFTDLSPEGRNVHSEHKNIFSPRDEPEHEVVHILKSDKRYMPLLRELRKFPVYNKDWDMFHGIYEVSTEQCFDKLIQMGWHNKASGSLLQGAEWALKILNNFQTPQHGVSVPKSVRGQQTINQNI